MRSLLLTLALALAGCGHDGISSATTHTHHKITVRSYRAWEPGRVKGCMIFNGGSFIAGQPKGEDPKEMDCFGDEQLDDWQKLKFDGNPKHMPYLYVATVELDSQAEEAFKSDKRFAAPVRCTKTGETFMCMYDEKSRSNNGEGQ